MIYPGLATGPGGQIGALAVGRVAAGEPPAANWWEPSGAFTVVAAYQPKGAASLAASYVNLANPGTFDAVPTAVPTWAAGTGWGFAGAEYLTAGFSPIQDQTWSMLIRASDVNSGAANRTAAGVNGGGVTMFRLSFDFDTGFNRVVYSNNGNVIVSPRLAAGVLGIAGRQGYRNGVANGALVAVSAGTFSASMFIGARNNVGTPAEYFIGNIQAVAVYSTTLDAGQVAEISDAMALL